MPKICDMYNINETWDKSEYRVREVVQKYGIIVNARITIHFYDGRGELFVISCRLRKIIDRLSVKNKISRALLVG